jgi:hypothetical protein
MSRMERITREIEQLPPEELTAFREWFLQFDALAWDRQFEFDVKAGKLDQAADRALRDHEAGRSTKL